MSTRTRLSAVVVFALTMGYFEGAVVVYLRRLWETGQFDVARLTLGNRLALTEVLREAASLAMIASVGWLAGRRGLERLAHCAVIFGIWDIVYYLALRLLIGWPASLLDGDVLFLIPRPWVGPVLAPLLVSAALVVCGVLAVLREDSARPLEPRALDWVLGLAGGAAVIVSFLIVPAPLSPDDPLAGYCWPLFVAGLALALAAFFMAGRRGSPAPLRG